MNVGSIENTGKRPPGKALLRRLVIGARPRNTIRRALLLAGICVVVFRFVWIPVWVQGHSMAPTLQDGAFRFAHRLGIQRRPPQRGDVVVIELAGQRAMYLKRILAVPGDAVQFRDGTLWVNGEEVPEPYVVYDGNWNTGLEQLGPDEFFVAGDNRSEPWEWHTMGVVDRERIAGRVGR